MEDRVARVAAGIDAAAVPVGLARLEALGEAASGAQNFYAVRLRRGSIFADYDLALARALLAWPAAPKIVHDIGGGFANLAMLLAGLGYRALCLEIDPARCAAAERLLGAVSEVMPEVRDNCDVLNVRFPDLPASTPAAAAGRPTLWRRLLRRPAPDAPVVDLARNGRMAVITNMVFTTSAEEKQRILSGLRDYSVAIIDIDRFLSKCASPQDRQLRLAEFSAAGLKGEPFLDLGASACFYRFIRG